MSSGQYCTDRICRALLEQMRRDKDIREDDVPEDTRLPVKRLLRVEKGVGLVQNGIALPIEGAAKSLYTTKYGYSILSRVARTRPERKARIGRYVDVIDQDEMIVIVGERIVRHRELRCSGDLPRITYRAGSTRELTQCDLHRQHAECRYQ